MSELLNGYSPIAREIADALKCPAGTFSINIDLQAGAFAIATVKYRITEDQGKKISELVKRFELREIETEKGRK